MITKERFTELMAEQGLAPDQIEHLWFTRPAYGLDEEDVKAVFTDDGANITKERFAEILKEYKYSDEEINIFWEMSGTTGISETATRYAAKNYRAVVDALGTTIRF